MDLFLLYARYSDNVYIPHSLPCLTVVFANAFTPKVTFILFCKRFSLQTRV